MKTRILVMMMLLIVIGISAYGCSQAAGKGKAAAQTVIVDTGGITAEGRLEPAHFVDVGINAGGIVDEVLSQEGDQVQAGQVIARLKNRQVQTLEEAQANAFLELSSAYQAVRDSQKKLDDFAVPRVLSGMTAPEAAQVSLLKLETARVAFEPYKDMSFKELKPNPRFFSALPLHVLFDTGAYKGLAREYEKQLDVSWVNYRKAVTWVELETDLESAKAQLAQAQKDYDSLQDASFSENTAGVRAALANAEVRAPFAGTITNLDLKVGEFAVTGGPVLTIADLSSWVVKTTNLTEMDVANVREGEPVIVTFDAQPGVMLKGYVLTVAQNYSENLGNVVYEATIALSDAIPAPRWGMTAQVRFDP
jgi:multidrug resistance efflux pump